MLDAWSGRASEGAADDTPCRSPDAKHSDARCAARAKSYRQHTRGLIGEMRLTAVLGGPTAAETGVEDR